MKGVQQYPIVHFIFVVFMVKISDKGNIGHWSPHIAALI